MEQKICETTDATIVDLLKEDAEYDHNISTILLITYLASPSLTTFIIENCAFAVTFSLRFINMNRIQDSAYNRRLLTVRIIEKGSLAKIPITKIQTNQINDFFSYL